MAFLKIEYILLYLLLFMIVFYFMKRYPCNSIEGINNQCTPNLINSWIYLMENDTNQCANLITVSDDYCNNNPNTETCNNLRDIKTEYCNTPWGLDLGAYAWRKYLENGNNDPQLCNALKSLANNYCDKFSRQDPTACLTEGCYFYYQGDDEAPEFKDFPNNVLCRAPYSENEI